MERPGFRLAELGLECGSAARGILSWIGNAVAATGRLQLGEFRGVGYWIPVRSRGFFIVLMG